MLRAFLRDAWLYGTTTFFSKGLSFLLLPLWTRYLRPADFGLIEWCVTLSIFANVLVAQEINQGVARYLNAVPEQVKGHIISANLRFVGRRFAWATFGVGIFLGLLHFWWPELPSGGLLVACLAYGSCTWIFYALQEQLRWDSRMQQYANAQIISNIGAAIFTFAFLIICKGGLIGFLWGQTLGFMVACAWLLRQERVHLLKQPHPKILESLLAFSRPLVVPALLTVIGIYADRLLIQALLGSEALGLYSVVLRIGLIVSLLLQLFQTPLMPLIYKHQAEAETPAKIGALSGYFALGLAACITGLAIFSKEIVALMAAPPYWECHRLLPWVALKLILVQVYVFTPGLAIAERTDILGYIQAGNTLFIALLSVVGIWSNGLYGLAIGGGLAALYFVGIYGYYSQRFYRIPYPFLQIVISIFIISISLIIHNLWQETPPFVWPLVGIKVAVWSVILMAIFYVRHSRLS